MDARALTDSISDFCQERLGLLALELEANEADADEVASEARRVAERLEVARLTGEVDLALLNDALRSNRRLDEHLRGRAVFEAVSNLMTELHRLMYTKLDGQ